MFIGKLAHIVKISSKEEPVGKVSVPFAFIHDEASWNEAYNTPGSPLRRYEDANPTEDLWNESEGRAAGFNDRKYIGKLDASEPVETTQVVWETELAQRVVINGTNYYTNMFYDMAPKTVQLYNDPAMAEFAHNFTIESVVYDNCVKCWMGAINAPGAQYPWATFDLPEGTTGEVEIEFDGNTYTTSGNIISLPSVTGCTAIDKDDQAATDIYTADDFEISYESTDLTTRMYVQFDINLTDDNVDITDIYKCVGSITATSANVRPLYLKGYTYGMPKPATTKQRDKLNWQSYMLNALKEYRGLRIALTSRVDLEYRYIVDTFEGFVQTECKSMLSTLCKEKDNAFAILNFLQV